MSEQHSSNWVLDSWRGLAPAYKVLWYYAVPINLCFFASGIVAGYFAATYPALSLLVLIVAPFYLGFMAWFCVALWRCAFNVSWKGWGYTSRAWVSLVAVGIAMQVVRVVNLAIGNGR
jgi:hypothetical protein